MTKVIFDTDMDTDCDDAGALAILHALADLGEIDILATVTSSLHAYAAPTVAAINHYYGRPDLPLGAPKGESAELNRTYRYPQPIAQEFPTPIHTNDDAPDAVTTYRCVLAGAPDGSVDVMTIGYVTNLYDLLHSPPDEHSDLPGPELVRRKVRQWVCMGGRYPRETNTGVHGNFKPDPRAIRYAAKHWPTPIVFSGLGDDILTGATLRTKTPPDNPVRRVYEIYLRDKLTRPSWDLIVTLFVARPHLDFWRIRRDGYNHIFDNGTNEWRSGEPDDTDHPTNHVLLELAEGVADELTATLEDLLTRPPKPH